MDELSIVVKVVLISIDIYYINVLDIPLEMLKNIDSVRHTFLWEACEKVAGGKNKDNSKMVCKPKENGGLGIPNLTKFSSALHIRWLWKEWKDESKPWIGLGIP